MALLSIKRDVDIVPGVSAPVVFHVSQNDVGTNVILSLLNYGTAYNIPQDTTVTIIGSASNGNVFNPVNATYSGSDVTFRLSEEMSSVAGPALCEAVLVLDDNALGTANFIINVEASPMGADVPPVFTDAAWDWMLGKFNSEIIPEFNASLIDAIDSKLDNVFPTDLSGKYLKINSTGHVEASDIEEIPVDATLSHEGEAADAKATGDALALKANESTIAPEFSESTAYTAGQYVYKNGVLYRFTSTHSGAWTGTDAETVTVGGEVEELKTAVFSGSGISLKLDKTNVSNKYVSSYPGDAYATGNDNSGKLYKNIVTVEKGIGYRIKWNAPNTLASNIPKACVIVDNNDVVRQIFKIKATANQSDFADFVPVCSGFLCVAIDKNITDFSVEILPIYSNSISKAPFVIPININDMSFTVGSSVAINANGKLKTSSSSRRARLLWPLLPNYKYIKCVPKKGFCVALYSADENGYATTLKHLSGPAQYVEMPNSASYAINVSKYDQSTTFAAPQDGVVGWLYLYNDGLDDLKPSYSANKKIDYATLCEFTGRAQGCATDGKNIFTCDFRGGIMNLVDIKTREIVKTQSFTSEQYGHMNSATYKDGKYYVASMNATGEVYVFDSTTLELLDTIIAVDGSGNPVAPWSIAYNANTDEFYSECNLGFLIYDGSFSYSRSIDWIDSPYSSHHTGQGCVIDENYWMSIASYDTNSINYWFMLRKHDGEYVTGINFPANGIYEIEDCAYDWENNVMYLSALTINGTTTVLMVINFYSEPNSVGLINALT